MNIYNYVTDLQLSVGESKRLTCPNCNGYKTFTATNNMGKLLWNCYKSTCKISGSTRVHLSVDDIRDAITDDVLDFDKDADEHAQFSVAFPKSWNLGTVTFQVFWSGMANTNGVSWGLQGVAVGNDNTIDVAYGSAVVVDDSALGAVEEICVTAESGAVTIAGSPADDELCYFRIFRDVSDGNDDHDADARLHGIKVFYTTDASNDA